MNGLWWIGVLTGTAIGCGIGTGLIGALCASDRVERNERLTFALVCFILGGIGFAYLVSQIGWPW